MLKNSLSLGVILALLSGCAGSPIRMAGQGPEEIIVDLGLDSLTVNELCGKKKEFLFDLLNAATNHFEDAREGRRRGIRAVDLELQRRGLDKRHCEGGSFARETDTPASRTSQISEQPVIAQEARTAKSGQLVGYKGETLDGKQHGVGTQRYKDGGSYQGRWRNGSFHGQGTLNFPDGKIYVGSFKDGQPHGQGALTSKDGRKFVGTFQNGVIHGSAVLYTTESETHGMWINGKIQGQAKIYARDGRVFNAVFKDNEMLPESLQLLGNQ